jgi:ribose-phosphate pyrophosphokinase
MGVPLAAGAAKVPLSREARTRVVPRDIGKDAAVNFAIVAGSSHPELGCAVAAALGTQLTGCVVERFPDGELRPVVEAVRGDDTYILQPTGPETRRAPRGDGAGSGAGGGVSDHLLELLLLIDACRRAGAARITAVVPYAGYVRQDRRSRAGEPVGARVVTAMIAAAGADRLLAVDPHTTALEAISDIPVEMLTAVPVLAGALADGLPPGIVVVAPDLGAVKRAEHYASLLGADVAVVRKCRLSGASVSAEDVVGDVAGRTPLIVDDMISTGGTVEAAARALLAHGARAEVVIAATHGLFVGPALGRLESLPLHRILVTDTLPQPPRSPLIEVCPIALLLADGVGRLHRDQSLENLLVRA